MYFRLRRLTRPQIIFAWRLTGHLFSTQMPASAEERRTPFSASRKRHLPSHHSRAIYRPSYHNRTVEGLPQRAANRGLGFRCLSIASSDETYSQGFGRGSSPFNPLWASSISTTSISTKVGIEEARHQSGMSRPNQQEYKLYHDLPRPKEQSTAHEGAHALTSHEEVDGSNSKADPDYISQLDSCTVEYPLQPTTVHAHCFCTAAKSLCYL